MSEVSNLYNKTKGQLFFAKGAGMVGSQLCRLKFVWTTELDTAAINDTTLYWNPDFFLRMDEKTRVTILAHEIWHNLYMHGLRLGNRDRQIWNIAADHVINLMLKAHGYYMDGFPFFMDDKYVGWGTEDVYDDLYQQATDGGKCSPDYSKIGGAHDEGDLGGDVLIFGEDPTEDGDGEDKPAPSQTEIAQMIQESVGRIVGSMTVARLTNKAGDIPGEVEEVINKFLNPILPWETLLAMWMNELTDMEYSYRRPNRRYEDPLLRGPSGNNGLEHLIYFQDVSGSITDAAILRFNSELKYVHDEFRPERMTVVTFDTEIRDIYEFTKEDDFDEIVVHGRGGTNLEHVFEMIRDEQPNAAIIFTDLHVRIPEEDPRIPLLWVVEDNPDGEVPFGRKINIPQQVEEAA